MHSTVYLYLFIRFYFQFCGAPGGDGESSSSGYSADSGRGFSDDSEVQHKQLHRYGRQGKSPGGQNSVERTNHGTGRVDSHA